MYISKITAKGQVTIPYRLRKSVNFNKGDNLSFELDGDRMIVKKIQTNDHKDVYLSALSNQYHEWLSDDDEKAFKNL